MKTGFRLNFYNEHGYCDDECVLLYMGDTIVKFESLQELRDFAYGIIDDIIPEIVENCWAELDIEDQKAFADGNHEQ